MFRGGLFCGALLRRGDWLALAKSPSALAMDTLTSVKDLLFTLLLKVGVSSSFAALLARWTAVRRVLFTEERDPDQKVKLMLFMTPPLVVGVALRLLGFPYPVAYLTLEDSFLIGFL